MSRSGSLESTATIFDVADAEHRVPLAEQLLEVDVADVARVVVAGDHDHRLALDRVEVLAREHVLVLEAVGGEVAGDDDDVRLHLVHLGDRALEVLRQEELLPAMEIRQLHDPEHGPEGYAVSPSKR